MKLLLDTHIWLWAMREPDRVKPAAMNALSDPSQTWCLSTATFWEIMVLEQKKRDQFSPDAKTWIRTALKRRPVREIPISREIALLSREIELGTEDPVDRFIAATAKVFDLTLVTSDAHLLACREIATLPNR